MRIQAAVRYVEERIGRPISIDEVARYVELSPFHFHRLFSAEVGEPFYGYIKRVRMTGAAARLKWTTDSLFEIATAFGYASNAAFSHAFSAYFGMPPRRFRDDDEIWPNRVSGYEVDKAITVRMIVGYHCLARRYYGHYSRVPAHWRDFIDRLPAQFSPTSPNIHLLGLVYDDPRITPADQIRYDCCIMFNDPAEPPALQATDSLLPIQTRPGRYALLEHEGPPISRGISYSLILDEWLPRTRYVMTDDPAIEIFSSAPIGPASDHLKFQILMPLE